ncbi:MAG: D-amino acid aminotransferase [Gammaproteobacteria bacterium]|nr:D-amino acid aminotransferase [Gammaproteobacteria bacterium]
MTIVYLNGQFLPENQAYISVLDRGFIFGDGVYEVIPVYGGRLFRINEHIDRLDNSLNAIRLTNPLTRQEWSNVLKTLVEKNGIGDDLAIYLQITRGVAKRNHALPEKPQHTVFAMANPLATTNKPELLSGIAAITHDDYRWKNCHIKSISLLPNILLRQQAIDTGAMETILIRDGEATEGAASNLFIVDNDTIITPPKGPFLLPGITRDLVLELARKNGLAHQETAITETVLQQAQEIWLTSSMKEIMPVTRLNGVPVSKGVAGPVWSTIFDLFQCFKQQLRAQSL